MAGRSNTELKVFLNGSLTNYQNFCKNETDKQGSVFFDKTDHTIYVEGNKVVGTQVENVVWDNDDKILTIYPISGAPIDVELGVDDALNTLKTTLEKWVGDNYVKQVAGSRLMTDGEGTKLAGIDEGAQTNRYVTVNGDILGLDSEYNKSTIKISGNLVTAPNNGEDSEVEFNLSMWHDSTNKKIHFFNLPKEQATATNVDKALFSIDTSEFVKDSFVKSGSYNSSEKALILTLVTGKNDDGSDKTEEIKIPVGDLIDEYTAGNGLSLSGTTFSAKLGYGLEFDAQNKIKLYPNPNGGIKVDAGGVALKAATNGGIIFGDGGGIAVDFTKAPVQSVNGQTGAVNIDVTPKVWSF